MDANTTTATPAVKPTLVNAQKFLEVARGHGFEILEQAGFFKIMGPKGHNLYVAKNAKGVRRIDVSGWKLDASLIENTVGAFGNVTGQLSLKGDEAEQIARFDLACLDMKAQPAKVPTPKATPPAPAPRPTPPNDQLVSVAQLPAEQGDSSVIA